MLFVAACKTTPSEPPLTTLTGVECGSLWFNSSSPYDFVNAYDGSAPAIAVNGDLALPGSASAEAPVPAMIVLHGSGGRGVWLEHYSSALTSMGIAALTLDSYGPRGVQSTVIDQSSVTSQMMLADSFAALRLLASDPRIDGDRIGIMGFSKGGIVSLYSAFEGISGWYSSGKERFAAHVAFYPFCGVMPEQLKLTGAPVIMLLGSADNYTPARQCHDLQTAADPEEKSLKKIVYPGAHHAFTSFGPVKQVRFFNPSDCELIVDANGVTRIAGTRVSASNPAERRAALRQCGSIGVTIGGNAAARSRSMDDMKAFLQQALRMIPAS